MIGLLSRRSASGLTHRAGCWLAVGLLFATPAPADEYDPFEETTASDAPADVPLIAAQDPFDELQPTAPGPTLDPIEQLRLQPGGDDADNAMRLFTLPPAECGTPDEKPLHMLTIDIQIPQGELPTNQATACWEELNAASGPLVDVRPWAVQCYFWHASCMSHRPLYFEETNLERYGYGCSECLQPFVSAAHFFGTVPALPYCMAAAPPCKCQYTLGHYRPGSCPPWQCHRPPCSRLAGLAEGGALTGMIFLIP